MDENEEFEFRHRAEQEAKAAPVAPPVAAPVAAPAASPADPSLAMAPIGGLENLATLATGIPASIAGGVAYGGAAIGKALGADVDPAAVQRNTTKALTYAPISDSGKAGEAKVGEILSPIVAPVANALDEGATALGKVSPTAETFAREAGPAAQAALSVVPGVGMAKGLLAKGASAAEAATVEGAGGLGGSNVENLRAAGYKVRPTDVKATDPGAKVPGVIREGMQGSGELKKDFGLHNQTVTTKLAAEDLGLKNTNKITPEDFETVRKPAIATYEEAGKTAGKFAPSEKYHAALDNIASDKAMGPKVRAEIAEHAAQFKYAEMNGPDTIKEISALRRKSTGQIRSKDVNTQELGYANRRIAGAMEDEIAQRLEGSGSGDLVTKFRDARTTLAKSHDIQSATKAGQVDAAVIGKLSKRDPGKMTGPLKIIADAHDTAPQVMQHSTKLTGVGSSIKADSLFGAVKSVAGKAASKLPGMDIGRAGFQNKFGRTATEGERSYFDSAGKTERFAPAREAPPQFDQVDFQASPQVQPGAAGTLAGDLELAPDYVPNAQAFPDAPDMMTADTPAPVRFPDAVDFTPQLSPKVQQLAAELGLIEDMAPDGLPYKPPTMAGSMAGDLSLDVPQLADQLGLQVDTPQPSLMTPVKEPVPFGPRVQLEAPPGKVGHAKKRKPRRG